MNSTVIARQAMKILAQEPSIDAQIHILGKIIRDFEKVPDESSHRLCQDLRANLKRIRETPGITPDQTRDSLGLLKRIPAFDPRRKKDEAPEEFEGIADSAPIDSSYKSGEWYMHPAPPNDEHEFLRLLDVERKKLAACDEPEWLVYLDDLMRTSTTPPCGNYGFTPEGLLAYAHASRGPFTRDGELTYGGKRRADALLCRERLIAGKVAPVDRKPDLTKLKDYVSPLFWELFVERS